MLNLSNANFARQTIQILKNAGFWHVIAEGRAADSFRAKLENIHAMLSQVTIQYFMDFFR